jgi:hypothetical protein
VDGGEGRQQEGGENGGGGRELHDMVEMLEIHGRQDIRIQENKARGNFSLAVESRLTPSRRGI